MYVCFKGVKDGWSTGCRKVIEIDGCFLKSTIKGVLLTAVGRDANNQMFPIAWAVAGAENKDTWNWFLSLLHDDLVLNQGTGLTIISDGHKGLLEAVGTWLPNAEHMQSVRYIYANFKKRWNGLVYRNLFWGAAYSTIPEDFQNKMEERKNLDQMAYDYLIKKNPNTWCKAFFQMDRSCATFENGKPKKKRQRHPTEEPNKVSRVGREMTCKNCYQKGHNKKTCKNEPKEPPARKKARTGSTSVANKMKDPWKSLWNGMWMNPWKSLWKGMWMNPWNSLLLKTPRMCLLDHDHHLTEFSDRDLQEML